ncbi:MAG: DUF4147 domain-containing protein [Candidatus Liptonbacteria bacterium]|nr:DUF4147 domain-containing protein [Candidatus Liptonbacteria bacterium]
MKIQNWKELATSDLRRTALNLAETALAAIDTRPAVRRAVAWEDSNLRIGEERLARAALRRIFLVTVGKCAGDAAAALEEILGDQLAAGIALDIKPNSSLRKVNILVGTHPLPSAENVAAAHKILDLLRAAGLQADDLVLVVVSGGGSTLLCTDRPAEERGLFQNLTRSGATIQEMNTVRKHLSMLRGGFLAQAAYPAQVRGLIFSDVPGNDIQFIASGPTVADATTIADAEQVLARYGLPPATGWMETPKDPKYFQNVRNLTVVSNAVALQAMAAAAQSAGYAASVVTETLSGEAAAIGRQVLADLKGRPGRTVLLYGGETTVTVRGAGRGGRNLEVALAALPEIGANELILTLATDGHDNGPWSGAICDIITQASANQIHLQPDAFLAGNDSYGFFELVGNYLVTGPTGANVSDIIIALKE